MDVKENKTKKRILNKASELFLIYGYSRVTMDEICRSLVMSRKTMYKYFSNKEDLLREVALDRSKCKGDAIDSIFNDDSLDFMQKFQQMIEFIRKETPKESIQFMQDVKTNAPTVWAELIEMRNRDIPIKMGVFLKDGVKKGFIKKNINSEIFIRMYIAIVNELMNPETILALGYPIAELIEAIDSILFFGILDQNSPKFQKTTTKKKYQ
jgi:AcrR family transcriptional regulator